MNLDFETALLRRMTPDQKLATLQSLLRTAWALTEAGIALRHPSLTPAEVHAAAREAFRRVDP